MLYLLQFVKFADDANMFCCEKELKHLYLLEEGLNKLKKWSHANKLL